MQDVEVSTGALLARVDRAAFAAGFVDRLRSAGVTVTLSQAESFVKALHLLAHGPGRGMSVRSRLYWTARVTLVHRPEALDAFDKVFDAVFESAVFSLDPVSMRSGGTGAHEVNVPVHDTHLGRKEQRADGLPWATLPRVEESADPVDATAAPLWIPVPNWQSELAGQPFDKLDAAQLRQIDRWLDDAITAWPTRRSRRQRPGPGAAVDLRRTIADSRRTDGEVMRVRRRRAVLRPRPMVWICDVSQSMQPYTTAYLHIMRAVSVRGVAESFAFATSLTRMTPLLKHGTIDQAVSVASARVTDRFGGTRIAHSLRSLLRSRHGQRLRGAICVIASDGWDSDPSEELGKVMRSVALRAHSVIWLNPRAGEAGFEPSVAGMRAALPWCDALVPAGRVGDLPIIIDHVVNPPRHRRSWFSSTK